MKHIGMQVLELFKAADKYDVAGLVKECVQIFKKITHAADVAPLLQVWSHVAQKLRMSGELHTTRDAHMIGVKCCWTASAGALGPFPQWQRDWPEAMVSTRSSALPLRTQKAFGAKPVNVLTPWCVTSHVVR